MISDLLSFQEQINGAINAFPSVAEYGANGVLDNQLREMLITEPDLNKWSANIAELLVNGSANWIAGTNADMVTDSLGEYSYTQDALDFFSFEYAINSIESWFNSL